MEIEFNKLTYHPEMGIFTKRIKSRNQREVSEVMAGWVDSRGYRRLKIKGKTYYAHRLAWELFHGFPPVGDIDHINGDKADNRPENLRDVSKSINLQNRRASSKGSSSKYLGVSWDKGCNKWKAQIRVQGKKKYIGLYETEEAAYEAYLQQKRELHEGNTL
jgi:hypothetical protein